MTDAKFSWVRALMDDYDDTTANGKWLDDLAAIESLLSPSLGLECTLSICQ